MFLLLGLQIDHLFHSSSLFVYSFKLEINFNVLFQVLSQYAIDHAGLPLQGLNSLCPNVVDLDLSSNTLEDWAEVLPLIAQLPSLKFVNLSHNKLKNYNVSKSLSRLYLQFTNKFDLKSN